MWSPGETESPLIVMLLVSMPHPPTGKGRRASPWRREMHGGDLISEAEQPPGPGGGVEVEAGVDVGQVEAAHLPDPLEPVAQRGAVDGQSVGGLVVVAAALQVGRQRPDQLGAVSGVV